MRTVLALLIGLMLFGCEAKMPTLTAQHVDMAARDDEVLIACYKSLSAVEVAKQQNIASIPAADRGMVIMLSQQGEFSKAMLAMATGESINPCGDVTNIHDVEIASMKAATDITNSYINMTKWVGGVAIGTWGLTSLIDAAASGTNYYLSGGAKMNQNSQNTGSFNSETGGSITSTSTLTTNSDDEICDGCSGDPSFGVGQLDFDCESDEDCDDGYSCVEGLCLLPETGYQDCLDDPWGYSDSGTPLYSEGISCSTYYGG